MASSAYLNTRFVSVVCSSMNSAIVYKPVAVNSEKISQECRYARGQDEGEGEVYLRKYRNASREVE